MPLKELLTYDTKPLEAVYNDKIRKFGLDNESHPRYETLKKLLFDLFHVDTKWMYAERQRNWVNEVVAESRYPKVQFTYGTVPLTSFIEIFEGLETQIAKANKKNKTFYALGSSIGWVAFLAHLYFSFNKVEGVELIKPLNDIAECLNKKYSLDSHIQFKHEDVVNIDYSDAGFIWSPSLLWCGETRDNLAEKWLGQLSNEALIVSLNYPGSKWLNSFECVKKVKAEASWTKQHTYWVYKKRSEGLTDLECQDSWR